jgi:hypothetical protein
MSLPSHAGDSAVESCKRRHCRVMLAIALPRRLGRNVMSMLSHAADGAAKVTWPWRDVTAESCGAAESCWRWCC